MSLSTSCKPMYYFLLCCTLVTSLFLANTANATTYYVATTGNDSNPGTSTQPFRSIKKGVRTIAAWDTLYIKSGTYYESINSNSITIPTGTSWNNAPVIAAFPGDTVTLRPGGNNTGEVIVLAHSYIQYVIFDRLIVDATGKKHGISTTHGAHNVRFKNVEVKNATRTGVALSPGSQPAPYKTAIEFINCDIHHNGTDHFDHGFYISTGYNLIKQSRIHHNAGHGVQVYSDKRADQNLVAGNRIYNNSTNDPSAPGILFSSGDGNMAYNNIVYGNKYGIQIMYRNPTNSKVYNNTIYNNKPGHGITISGHSTNALAKNNVVYYNGGAEGNIRDHGISSQLANNLTTNPKFVNQSNADFHLQAGSPAIDAGTSISGITTDIAGVARPQGSSFDIGAYEFQGSSSSGGGGSSSGGSTGGTSSFPPTIVSPAPGSTLTSTSVTFTAGHSSSDAQHWVYVGSTYGGSNFYAGGVDGNHRFTVSGLPSSGTIHVAYFSRTCSSCAWQTQTHTYTMSVGSSSGGSTGGTSSFPPTIVSPAPGSTLTSTSVTFTAGHSSSDAQHWVYVGSTYGGSNFYAGGVDGNHRFTVSGLPSSGTIHVAYFSRTCSSCAWQTQTHTYTMSVGSSSGGSTGGTSSFPPTIVSPAPGSTLTSTSVTFTAGHSSSDAQHWVYVGSTFGGSNFYAGGVDGNHRFTVSGLPSSGTIHVAYFSRTCSSCAWQTQTHIYTMKR